MSGTIIAPEDEGKGTSTAVAVVNEERPPLQTIQIEVLMRKDDDVTLDNLIFRMLEMRRDGVDLVIV